VSPGDAGCAMCRAIPATAWVASVAWLSPSPPVLLAGPKSKIQFNGVGGLRTYITLGTFFAAASGAPRAVSRSDSNGPSSKKSDTHKTESRETDRPLPAGPVPYGERRRHGKFKSLFGRS
jgi:hypothetical protein